MINLDKFIKSVYIDGGIREIVIVEFVRGMAWALGALLITLFVAYTIYLICNRMGKT